MNVKQFYLDINGNYQGALSIMMNDMLIERMIRKFMGDNSCKQIVSCYQEGKLHDVFVLSHTLKGVAGNLSLTPLYEISCVITEATRNNDQADIAKEIKQLEDIYSLIEQSFQKNI